MRYKNFMGSVFSIGRMFFLFLFVASIYACNKDAAPGPPTSLTEMGSNIGIAHADTSLVLSWSPGLAAWEGDSRQAVVSYEVQVSSDSTFNDASQNVFDFITDSTSLFLSDQELTPLEPYFARVRTVASTGTGNSPWMRTSRFQVRPIELFTPIKVWNLSHEAVVLNFGRHGELTKMVVETADGANPREFDVSDDKLISMQLDDLTSNTNYVARLFRHDDRSLGVLEFSTKPTVEEAGYIDLRGSSDPQILQNTLNTVPDGSVIALKRGMTYTMEGFTLDRGVTLISEPGFGPQARIEMSSSFDVAGSINLIKFEDVAITGDMGSTYVFNLSSASDIARIELESCLISDQRGVLRLKDAGLKHIDSYVINNSIVQNIGGYNVLMGDHADASVNNVFFTNSTFINVPDVIRWGNTIAAKLNSIVVEDVTFFRAPNDNKYLINTQRTGSNAASLNIRNTLFGYTEGARSFNGNNSTPKSVSTTNSFATSDSKWDRGLITGVIAYPATSEQIFAAPDKTNFANSDLTIIDETLFTVGDPRWRP
ncbi:DUF4957 domain-containing protein [Sphingobacterium sp. SGR-19]|uniref:DUF4957 domain-containing protein n=1 Tax=Sphingobacterium sp. SGR-19 TaxID=2710886 RepID=UPI0013EBB3C2|nr:DUF5123 domain-containing protein [Sphingobacterium sp. SGR-19]NGM64477.1 DUF4957 domain-containing protein [Sphingobacterium sp. SGR-19]